MDNKSVESAKELKDLTSTPRDSKTWIKGIDYPEWMVYRSLETLKGGYLIGDETPRGAMERIARRVNELMPDNVYDGNLEERVFQALWNQEICPSSPVWSNFGTNRGLGVSCFQTYIHDSISGIYNTLAENAKMSQLGGGSSSTWHDVRPRGSKISGQVGSTGGPYEFLENYDVMINKVSQGSCYKEGTKVLTDKGFKDFRDVNPEKDLIAQLDEYNNIDFTNKYELTSRDWNGELIKIEGKSRQNLIDIEVTPNHRMVIERCTDRYNSNKKREIKWKGHTEITKAEDLKLHSQVRFFFSGKIKNENKKLTFQEKLMIAYQADGEKYYSGKRMRFILKKERKIKRLEFILSKLNLEYTKTPTTRKGQYRFSIKGASKLKNKTFDWINISNVDLSWGKEFIEELSLWDGHKTKTSNIQYSSIIESNVIKVQELSSLLGKQTSISKKERGGNRKTLYTVNISEINYTNGHSCIIKKVPYKGKVYCAIVPKGRLLVSKNGRTLVCGNTRRGSHAVYQSFDHPDVEEFLKIKQVGSELQNLFSGIIIDKEDRENIYNGDPDALRKWSKILESRNKTGIPYLSFKDNANDGKSTPPWYGLKNTQINGSNLCNEIQLPSNEYESYTCVLLSMNAITYDKWSVNDSVQIANIMLESINEDFIIKTTGITEMQKARRFAQRHRALGLGLLGYHSFLQSKNQPFIGFYSTAMTRKIFNTMKKKSRESSKKLAKILGNAPVVEEYNKKYGTNHKARHATLLAVAPTVSNATISGGVSSGIEPLSSNYFSQKSAKGNFTVINKYLTDLIANKYPLYNNKDTMDSIRDNSGSVQHLDWMDKEDKEVFRTFSEINQFELVRLAAVRQEYIDQGQSLNVHIAPDTDPSLISALYLMGAELGIKGFYYQRSSNILRTKNGVNLDSMDASACGACDG